MSQVQFHLDYSHYARAQKLHRRRWQGLDLLLPICGAIVIAAAVDIRRDHFYGVGAIEFLLGAYLLAFPLIVRLNWRYCYRRTQSGDNERTFEFNDDGIRTRTVHSFGEIEWAAIRSFAEDKTMFLLYLAPSKFIPIPKLACTADQIDELRALFQRHIRQEEP